MFWHSTVLIFPIVFRDRDQISFVILRKYDQITNFCTLKNHQKTLFSKDFMGNRS